MIKLTHSLQAWGKKNFSQVFIREITELGADVLPLQFAVTHGSYALTDQLSLSLLSIHDEADSIKVKTSIFFHSVIAGCQCSDDPSPLQRQNEYAEMVFVIDKNNAATHISLVS